MCLLLWHADSYSFGRHTITSLVGDHATAEASVDICIGRQLCFSMVLK